MASCSAVVASAPLFLFLNDIKEPMEHDHLRSRRIESPIIAGVVPGLAALPPSAEINRRHAMYPALMKSLYFDPKNRFFFP